MATGSIPDDSCAILFTFLETQKQLFSTIDHHPISLISKHFQIKRQTSQASLHLSLCTTIPTFRRSLTGNNAKPLFILLRYF
jgi:hypothetical protein